MLLTVDVGNTQTVLGVFDEAGTLQHHVHETRAPQPAATGGIAANIAPRFGDQIGRAKAAVVRKGFSRAVGAPQRRLAARGAHPMTDVVTTVMARTVSFMLVM